MKVCSVKGCGRTKKVNMIYGEGPYCAKHQNHIKNYGKIKTITRSTPNEIILYDNYAEVVLRNIYHKEVCRTIIDLEDVELVRNYKWYMNRQGYVASDSNKERNHLHRFVMNAKKREYIDHINRNILDNRKINLRFVTNRINTANTKISKNNTSGVVGVYFSKPRKKWIAQIFYMYKPIYLGGFGTIEEATKVRKDAELKYFGEVIKR